MYFGSAPVQILAFRSTEGQNFLPTRRGINNILIWTSTRFNILGRVPSCSTQTYNAAMGDPCGQKFNHRESKNSLTVIERLQFGLGTSNEQWQRNVFGIVNKVLVVEKACTSCLTVHLTLHKYYWQLLTSLKASSANKAKSHSPFDGYWRMIANASFGIRRLQTFA